MDLHLIRVILICFWVLNGLQIFTYLLVYAIGYGMFWDKLGSAYGGMFLFGYLLEKLQKHIKDQENN